MYMCINILFSMIRRKPTTRQLWDRTTDRWEHDMYKEEEQGPKTKEELEVRCETCLCNKCLVLENYSSEIAISFIFFCLEIPFEPSEGIDF